MHARDLAEALISLVRDIEPALLILVEILCYLLGLFAFFRGVMRLLRHSERGHVSGAGTAVCFLTCVVLATLPSWLSAARESLFGLTGRALGYGETQYGQLLDAVFVIIGLVGLYAFVRGLFVLRAAADGEPGPTTGAAFAHMIGGLAAWHITDVIAAVQKSLGITALQLPS